jgi:hypothetical protein
MFTLPVNCILRATGRIIQDTIKRHDGEPKPVLDDIKAVTESAAIDAIARSRGAESGRHRTGRAVALRHRQGRRRLFGRRVRLGARCAPRAPPTCW